MNIDIEITRIETAKTAVLEHRGSAERVNESVNKFKVRYLYSTWLPESGEMRRDFPVFFSVYESGAGST